MDRKNVWAKFICALVGHGGNQTMQQVSESGQEAVLTTDELRLFQEGPFYTKSDILTLVDRDHPNSSKFLEYVQRTQRESRRRGKRWSSFSKRAKSQLAIFLDYISWVLDGDYVIMCRPLLDKVTAWLSKTASQKLNKPVSVAMPQTFDCSNYVDRFFRTSLNSGDIIAQVQRSLFGRRRGRRFSQFGTAFRYLLDLVFGFLSYSMRNMYAHVWPNDELPPDATAPVFARSEDLAHMFLDILGFSRPTDLEAKETAATAQPSAQATPVVPSQPPILRGLNQDEVSGWFSVVGEQPLRLISKGDKSSETEDAQARPITAETNQERVSVEKTPQPVPEFFSITPEDLSKIRGDA
jgi:hypothetical protein